MTPQESLDVIEVYVLGVLEDCAAGSLPVWYDAATVASRVFHLVVSACGRADAGEGGLRCRRG